MELSHDPGIVPLSTYPREMKTFIQQSDRIVHGNFTYSSLKVEKKTDVL